MLLRNSNNVKVIIFGTGGLSNVVSNSLPCSYEIIAYADNNHSMHGKYFRGTLIIPATNIHKYDYDKIIIASQYYNEILDGLKKLNHIDIKKIRFFNDYTIGKSFKNTSQKIGTALFNILSIFNNAVIDRILNKLFANETQQVKKIKWLDECHEYQVEQLRPSTIFKSFGPDFYCSRQTNSNINIPAVNLYRFDDVTVSANSRAIIDGEHIIIERGLKKGCKQGDYSGGWLIEHATNHALLKRFKTNVIDKAILINAVSDSNYYHCLIELIPQFYYLNELDSKYEAYPIAIPEKALSIHSIKACFESLKSIRDIILLNPNESYLVANLLLLTTPNNNLAINLKNGTTEAWHNYLRKESLDFVRSSAINYSKEKSASNTLSRRVFLARKGPIRSYNQDEIIDLVSRYGFQVYYLEEMAFHEQVQLFQNADYFIGPSGAAWTNLIFASHNAKALCWQPVNSGDLSCFSNLAHAYGVKLEYLQYSTIGRLTRELFWEPYTISIEEVKHWLNNNISTSSKGQENAFV